MSPRVSSPALAVVLALAILLAASAAHADTTVCTIQAPSSFSGSQQFGSCNSLETFFLLHLHFISHA